MVDVQQMRDILASSGMAGGGGGVGGVVTADSSGDVWFVDSVNGANAADGTSVASARATIASALASAAAGDTIKVMEGHAETLTAVTTISLAGLKLEGQGVGARRPAITFNAADDTVDVQAASVVISGLLFNEATAVTGGAINVGAVDCVIKNCQFDLGTNDAEAITVETAGDNLVVEGCFFNVTADGPVAAIEVEAAGVDGLVVRNNTFKCSDATNAFDTAAINSGVANTNMVVTGNTFNGFGVASTALVALTAVDKIVSGNVYGAEAVDADNVAAGPAMPGTNPFAVIWYVDAASGNDSFSGLSPRAGKASIAAAIAAGAAGDVIILSPGTHSVDVSAAALAPKADMLIRGAIPSRGGKPSTIITHDADDGADLVLIDVDGVVFEDIEFLLVAGGTTALRLIAVSQSTAVNGLRFTDCWFDLNDVDVAALFAIAIHDATLATTGVVIQGCRFHGGNTTTTRQANYIQVGVGGLLSSIIEENTFELESVDGDTYGVHFLDNGAAANKSYCTMIRNNDFFGPLDAGTDGVGVFVGGITELEILAGVRTNYFPWCTNSSGAGSITIDRLNEGIMNNYVGDDATGGTLVDPGT